MRRQREDQYCFMDHWIPEVVAELVFPFHMLLLTALENGNTAFRLESPRSQGQSYITTAGSTDTVQSDHLFLVFYSQNLFAFVKL